MKTCVTCVHYFVENEGLGAAECCARTAQAWSKRSSVDGEVKSGVKYSLCKVERWGGVTINFIIFLLTRQRHCGEEAHFWQPKHPAVQR